MNTPANWLMRVPFYYGWVIVGIAFVTMAIAVTARTAFSLLMPPLIDEFGWNRGLTAGAFSFGFGVSAFLSPIIGRAIDRYGPRPIIESGVALMTAGLLFAPWISSPWHLYLTLGLLVGAGANFMSFTAQSLYLPNWFVRQRAFAISVAFSGVGVGALLLLPWLQSLIEHHGWRTACTSMGVLVLLILAPINLFVWRSPQSLGLLPDGAKSVDGASVAAKQSNIVDVAWASTHWTLSRALRTARFWWIALGYACALFAWYAVQVHQTQYLSEIGFAPLQAAWALGLVSVVAIPGQIGLGALSDRIGREWVWTAGCAGFAGCYAALIALHFFPSPWLLYLMVFSQGFLGYALTSVMGPIVAEIFEGPHYGAIFGTLTIALIGGGAVGPWVTGLVHDATGSYQLAFVAAIGLCAISAGAIWLAAPRKVRLVPGKSDRTLPDHNHPADGR